jgi:hypothetical protein
MVYSCEYGNDSSGSIKCCEFFSLASHDGLSSVVIISFFVSSLGS